LSKLRKEKGIIVRTFKYGESSLILDILTESSGLKSFIIQSVRKQKSRISPSSVQLLASVDIDYYHKEDTELFQLKEIKTNVLWLSLYSDMRKMSMGMYMAELTKKIVNKYENHSDVYELLWQVLYKLENSDQSWSAHLWYTIQLKALSGFSLLKKELDDDHYYDIRSSQTLRTKPLHGYFFDKDMMEILKELEDLEIEHIDAIVIGKNVKNILLENLIEYFKVHVHNFTDVKSLDILKTVFE